MQEGFEASRDTLYSKMGASGVVGYPIISENNGGGLAGYNNAKTKNDFPMMIIF